ncbi:putative chaperone protein [Endobacter medicaginis]|uniref:Hsp70 family protein n=1 Tax=Endobacter medicaginis TaxID=1181271 RepID=A0A839USH6_9PROT|nr:Hsp70 family protein [Endobacter medicaginis]MBB3173208.1 putative chaperone protein [Endobacter medicaginis]MCX5476632.1 Hsp70 family protein [Endobacter medicaginis]NVN29956.1 Hsp70 family protein [Endobacter medicaginis]
MQTIGIDFGTTNTVVAVVQPDGSVRSTRFGTDDGFRSVLCFWSEQGRAGEALHHAAGPAGVGAYLDDPLDSRLILSMKSYLAQRSFTETRIFGRRFTLQTLIATFLRAMAQAAGFSPGEVHATIGRPVRFAGELADDAFGVERLRKAFAEAGFAEVSVVLEPEGAGWRFSRRLTRPTTVLVGDFGGGTSDFSVLRFTPGETVRPLGHAGVGLAGDAFDQRIIERVICPHLGRDDIYRPMGNDLPMPAEYYSAFARWHRLSMMRNPKTLREIAETARHASRPDRLEALAELIEDEQGFAMYQAVSAAKTALSQRDSATLRFSHGRLDIAEPIQRSDFEAWIAPDLARMSAAVDAALADAGLEAGQVDQVFLTGGTSFVPAVQRLFTDRFGAGRVTGGGELVSVAEGLALIGAG